jgi:hypothetical protein
LKCPQCGDEIVCKTCGSVSETAIRQAFGRKLGKTKSEAKAQAARMNGLFGGRPAAPGRRVALIYESNPSLFKITGSKKQFISRKKAVQFLRQEGGFTHYISPGGKIVKL